MICKLLIFINFLSVRNLKLKLKPTFLLLNCLPVGLAVVLVGGVQVPLQLVEQAALELVPHEEVEVGRLVQVVAVRLHRTDLLKRTFVKNTFRNHT